MSNIYQPIETPGDLTSAIERQELQKLRVAISQYSPEYVTDPEKLNQLLASEPDGPEVALQKLGSAMFYAKSLGYDPDYAYHNLDYVGKMWGVEATKPKDHWEWWNDNITARIKEGEINHAWGDIRKAKEDYGLAQSILKMNPNDQTYQKNLEQQQKRVAEAEAKLQTLKQSYTPPAKREGFEWAADTITGVFQGYISALTNPDGLKTATLSPGLAVAGSFAEQQTNDTYATLYEAGVDHSTAKSVARITGLVTGGLEYIQWKTITGGTGLKSIITDAVSKGMKVSTAKLAANVAKIYALRVAENWSQNMAEEMAQEAVAIAGEEIGKELANLPEDQRATSQEIVSRLLETAKASAIGVLPLALIGGGMAGRSEIKGLRQGAQEAQKAITNLANASPEIRQAVTAEYINNGAKIAEFTGKQEAAPTVFTGEDGPELFYHTMDEGQPVFYRSAEDAAAKLDGRVYATPQAIIEATRQKYGQAAAEWIQTVFSGNEVLTDAAKEQFGANLEAMRDAAAGAQRGEFDFRELTDQQRATIESLGLNFTPNDVVAVHLDAQPGRVWKGTEAEFEALGRDKGDFDAWDTGDRVIIKPNTPEMIIPYGATTADSIRIPTQNGRITIQQRENTITAINHGTGAEIATMEIEPGEIATITSLPERPQHARQMLQELKRQGTVYQLAVDQDTRDKILESDPGYRKLLSNLATLEKRQRDLAKRQITPDQIELAEAQAEYLEKEIDQAVESIGQYETDLLGEYSPAWAKTPEDMEAQAIDVAERNQAVGAELKAGIIGAAPQLEPVAHVLVGLMEIQANARGLTLADWRKRYLADDAFTRREHRGKRGAVQFLKDGRAIINLSTKSDPSTVIHELGHIIRRQLSPEDQQILLTAYKAESWTNDAEERFAADWETYFTEGAAPNPELATIFARIARFMREIYRAIRTALQPEVRAVIDRAMIKNDSSSIELQVKDAMFFQSEQEEISPSLIALHNIDSKTLNRVEKFGGLPMPSIAITKPEIPFTQFGNTTLILKKENAQKYLSWGDTYSRDIWSPTVPRPEWKVNQKAIDKFDEKLTKLVPEKIGLITSAAANKSILLTPDYKIWINKESTRLAFLRDTQGQLEIPMKESVDIGRYTWLADKEKASKYIEEYESESSDIDSLYMKYSETPKMEYTTNHAKMAYKKAVEIIYGKPGVDTNKLSNLIEEGMNGKEKEYQQWLDSNLDKAWTDPYVKVGKEKLPFNADSVYRWMKAQAKTGSQQTITYGPSKAASQAAKQFKDRQDMRSSEDLLKTSQEVDAAIETLKPLHETYQELTSKYETKDTWDALNELYKAQANYLKTVKSSNPAKMKSALEKAGFSRLTDDEINDAVDLAERIRTLPVDYFEAKPSDILQLSDFQAAIIPEMANQESIDALKRAGVEIIEYNNQEDRSAIVRDYAQQADVLFQPAYHGTPHRFDRFSTDAIGTGEGAQAYGWGLYFAGSKEVAEWYRENLGTAEGILKVEPKTEIERALLEKLNRGSEEIGAVPDMATLKDWASQGIQGEEIEDVMDSWYEIKSRAKNPGQVYKVEIPDDNEYLDWDNPLSEQSDKVKDKLKIYEEMGPSLYPRALNAYVNNSPMKWFYYSLKDDLGSDERASNDLKAAGIPGIRYLDGSSRSAGEGNYNYVIFDENDVEIVETFYQPEYTMPAETREILERIDQLEAAYKNATPEQQQVIVAEYNALTKAVGSAIDLWLYELEKAFNAGDNIPDQAIIEAAKYSQWAADELAFRQTMNWDPIADGMNTEQEPAEGEPSTKTRKEYETEFMEALKADPDGVLKSIRDTMLMINDLDQYIEAPDEIQQAQMIGMRKLLTGPLWIFVNAKNPNVPARGNDIPIKDAALQSLKNNPSRGMQIHALAIGDLERVAELDALEAREPWADTSEAKEKTERERVARLPFEERVSRIREILRGPFHKASADEIDQAYKDTSLELRRLTKEYKELLATSEANEARAESLRETYQNTYARLREIGKELAQIKRQAATMEKNQVEQIEALRQRREQLKTEIRGIKTTYQQFKREAAYRVRWTKAEAKQKLEQTVQAMKETQDKKDAARKAREYKRQVIKEILKVVPKSVDYTYADQIRNLQALLDPKKRPRAQARVKMVYKQSPSMVENMVDFKLTFEPEKETFTIEQLEQILEQIIALEIDGKAKRKAYLDAEASEVWATHNALMRTLEAQHDPAVLTRQTTTGEEKTGRLRQAYQATEEIQHIMDQLDGGGLDYQGEFYKRIYLPAQQAASSMTENINRRSQTIVNIMAEEKIKMHELYRPLAVESKPLKLSTLETTGRRKKRVKKVQETLKIETAIGIYMASQNEQSRSAITYGNKISEAQQEAIITALPDKFKRMANKIIEQVFDADYDRLATVHNRLLNKEMGRVDRYYPMFRQASGSEKYEEERSWEAQARAGTRRTPKDGMTKSRVDMADEMQTPIRIDAMNVISGAIEKQERFIAFAELSKRLNSTLAPRSKAGKGLTEAIDAVRPGTTKQITDWMARVVNRDSARDAVTSAMLQIKMRMSTYAMAYNVRSAINNTAGLALYLGESGPIELLKATSASPIMLGKMRKNMIKLAPEMDKRSLDQAEKISQRIGGVLDLRMQQFREAGFWMMKTIVSTMDTIGWTAVFNSKIKAGMTEQEAAQAATAAVLRTQPTGDALAQSDAESQTWSAIITPFASQAYKTFNLLTHLPNAKIKGAVKRYIQRVIGVSLSTGVFVGLIPLSVALANTLAGIEADDDDKEEMTSRFMSSLLLSNVPIIGSAMATRAEGYNTKGPFESMFDFIPALQKLVNDDDITDAEVTKVRNSLLSSGSVITGLPWVQAKRILEAIETGDAEALDRVIHAIVGGQL
jgi:hypothetical protein